MLTMLLFVGPNGWAVVTAPPAHRWNAEGNQSSASFGFSGGRPET
jgi:hypothetical protein